MQCVLKRCFGIQDRETDVEDAGDVRNGVALPVACRPPPSPLLDVTCPCCIADQCVERSIAGEVILDQGNVGQRRDAAFEDAGRGGLRPAPAVSTGSFADRAASARRPTTTERDRKRPDRTPPSRDPIAFASAMRVRIRSWLSSTATHLVGIRVRCYKNSIGPYGRPYRPGRVLRCLAHTLRECGAFSIAPIGRAGTGQARPYGLQRRSLCRDRKSRTTHLLACLYDSAAMAIRR